MPSILPTFEYDIFISYRHKDNKYDGWVTEFVANLKKEIEATFKEDITIYFDANPHDGLLETHDVDGSLKEKLKCLIFIPIISQTYCDPKSFAWTSELLAFVKMTSEDSLGLKIKLPNGNTASRVLPIRIHELDGRDRKLLEDVLGPLRAIDFTYQSAGVNRPLRQKDDEAMKGASQTIYRDQLNKTANAIKEIISGIQGETENEPRVENFKKDNASGTLSSQNKIRAKRTFKMPGYKTLFGWSAALALFLAVVLIKQSITPQPISTSTITNSKTSILLPDSIPLTFMAGPLGVGRRGLEISPDGKLIVYVHMKPGGISSLYLRAIDDYNINVLPGTDGAFSPIFSPDSKWIAFFSKDKLMKISVDGGVIETLTQTANAQDGIWAEDDCITWIANDGSSLNSINSKGKEYKSITATRLSSRPARISADEFLTSNARGETILTSFSKGAGKQVLSGGHSPCLYKDELIFIKGNDLLSVGFDRIKLEVTGTPILIEKNVSTGFYGQFSISMEGTLSFVRGPHLSRGQLTWRNIKGETQLVNLEPNIFGTFSISPSGKDLAILLSDTQGDVGTYNLEAPQNKIVISNEGFNDSPHWSSDGLHVFFRLLKNGVPSIVRKAADGRSEGEVILSNDSIVSISGLNKKGLLLYSTSEKMRGFSDLNLFALTKQREKYAFHSRKGVAESLAKFIKDDWIAFTSDQTGRSEVFISDLTKPDVRTQFSFEGGEEPRYDSVNQILYYREVNKLVGASLSFGENRSLKIGPAKVIFEDEDWINVPGYSWDMAPDGKRFLIIRRTSPKTSNEIKISQHFR